MTTVEIEYCVPCGFRDRALALAEELLRATEDDLEALSLLTGAHGVFAVRVDGETVYDKEEHAYETAQIVDAVEAAI
jgi:selenoprotein W-related protein